jgi:hypothetical protein
MDESTTKPTLETVLGRINQFAEELGRRMDRHDEEFKSIREEFKFVHEEFTAVRAEMAEMRKEFELSQHKLGRKLDVLND